jgi:hypothetical protein
MRIIKHQAKQAHPVPDRVMEPQGPFPREMFDEPEIVYDVPAYSEDGSEYLPGATAQNNYSPPKYLRCGNCLARVLETETQNHYCED